MTLTSGAPSVALAAGSSRHVVAARTRLSLPRYLWLTAAALAVTGGQLALLPRWLSAEQFGIVVLGISATQGVLQLGDLGFSRLCLDAGRSEQERARMRGEGLSLTLLATTLVIGAALGWAVLRGDGAVCLAVALGASSAGVVAAAKFRATALEVAGDERRAAAQNFLWTNAPKIGLVVALLAFRDATAVLAVGAAAGAVLCRPARARLRDGLGAARRYRQWLHPFLSIAAGFVLTWSDTYFLGAHLGLEAAGAYEAVYRVLGVCSYGFLPWASVITSRVSVAEARPVGGPLAAALATTVLATGGAALLLASAGPILFPHLDLPLAAVPSLVAFYVATTVAACVGSALYVLGRLEAVVRASLLSAALCVLGHAVFTVGGGATTAARVAASAMTVNAVLQSAAYLRETGRRPVVAGTGR